MSRATLAVLIFTVMVGGVLLGSLTTRIAGIGQPPGPTPTPTPTDAATGTPLPTSTAPELPISDAEGEEIGRLPRFPGSVRTEYLVDLDDAFRLRISEYMADATLDEVRTYYEGVIDEYGWSRADINYAAGEWTYVLVDGGTEALIELEVTNGLVEIDLQLSDPIAPRTSEPTPATTPTPRPTARPATPAPPAPAPVTPAPVPPPDDHDDDGGDDGGDDAGDESGGDDGDD